MTQRSAFHRSALLALPLLLAAPLAGCIVDDGPGSPEIKAEIEAAVPGARFVATEHVHLGRFAMSLVHGLTRIAGDHEGDEDQGLEMARSIHHLDVATYRVESLPPLEDLVIPPHFAEQLTALGWSVVVRTAERGERTWVLTHSEGPSSEAAVTGLCVVALDPRELTIVRLDGRLNRMFALALADHPKRLAALGKGEG